MKSPLLSVTEHPVSRELLSCLLILAAAFAIYGKALSYGFLVTWDDPAYVVNNVAAHGFSWEHIKTAFTSFFVGNYAPLQIVSYMLDYSLWGLNPSGYVFHNIFLHALNGYLLYRLLSRLSETFYPSILAALLFVSHPVQVESVVWISQRKNVLAMLFFLLSIHFYTFYRSSAGQEIRKHYALSLLFFACSLLTKSVAVVLPATLLLFDLCISRRKFLKAIPDKLPYIFFALIIGVIALFSQSDESGGGGRAAFHGGGIWPTLLTMLPVFVSYIRMAIIPVDLSIVYAPPIRTGIDAEVLFSMMIISLLAAAGFWLYKRHRDIFFWYALIPLAILPVSQIIPLVTLMNDRYLYFPMLGVAACSGLLARQLTNKVAPRWREPVFFCFSLLVALYGVASFQRISFWRDSISLWQDAVVKQPGSAVAWLVLGDVYVKRGERALAEKYFEQGKEVCRGVECFHALEKLATLHLGGGSLDKAEKSTDEMIRLFPKNANGYVLKGYLKYLHKDFIEAEPLFLAGLKLDRNQPSSLIALGNIYLATGRPALAAEKLKAAQMLGNPSPELYYGLASAEARLNNREAALNYLDQALRLGYNKSGQILKDSNLAPLRSVPEFSRLMQSYFPNMKSLKD